MGKKLTCAYCGRERQAKDMTMSTIIRKLICKNEITDCLRRRAGAVWERNAR